MKINHYWPVITTVVGVLCWYGGHWHALSRDKRKEFNAVVDRIRPGLDAELLTPGPSAKQPDTADINRLEHMLLRMHRRDFRRAVERYEKAHKEHIKIPANHWDYEYTTTDHIKAAIQELFVYVRYK